MVKIFFLFILIISTTLFSTPKITSKVEIKEGIHIKNWEKKFFPFIKIKIKKRTRKIIKKQEITTISKTPTKLNFNDTKINKIIIKKEITKPKTKIKKIHTQKTTKQTFKKKIVSKSKNKQKIKPKQKQKTNKHLEKILKRNNRHLFKNRKIN